MILGEIVRRNARRYPHKTAVVFQDKRFTFKEFNNRVNSLTNALLDMGMGKGDRFAVLLDNCHQYIELYFVAPKAGMVMVPLNYRLSSEQLVYIINNAEPTTLFLGENYLGLVNSIRGKLKGVKNFILIGTPQEGMKSYEDLVSRYPPDEPKVEVAEEDVAYLLYTGGTTGLPKGAMITHRAGVETAENSAYAYRLTPEDVGIVMVPAFWGALQLNILPWSYLGCTIAIIKEFDPRIVLEAIQREKVTVSLIIPTFITALLDCPDIRKYDLSSLRWFLFGSTPTAGEILKQAIGVFGDIFRQVYGLMETGWLTVVPPGAAVVEGSPEKVKRLQSCGQEILNVHIRIVDENGKDVPPGEVGELIAKGDNLLKGYWKLPQATEEALKGSYLYTGDMATMDENGFIYLVGRKKDIIMSGGRSIFGNEIEEVLHKHPSVLEAAVIGVPDAKLGEAIKAIVVLRKGKTATQGEIIGFCRQSLPEYALPQSVEFIDKLPRSTVGKILKRELRERYQRA